MTDDAAQRARMMKIIELTTEAVALADLSGDHMLAAKVDDSPALALDLLTRLDGGSGTS